METSFRAHFALPGASAAYAQLLLGQVPDLLVLPAHLLKPLVHDLAQRLAAETAATVSAASSPQGHMAHAAPLML